MKVRYFFKGLGTGILITTFALHFLYKNDVSDADIILKAKTLGMVYPEDISGEALEIDKTQESFKPAITKKPIITNKPYNTEMPDASTKLPATETTEVPTMVPTEVPTAVPTVEPTIEPTKIPPTQTPLKKDELISFTISRGDWSRVVSERLESLGIVDDAKKFDKFLVDKGYAVRIRVGNFKAKKNSSYEDIAIMITK